MNNQIGLTILSSVLDNMSYRTKILSPGQDDSNGIDVRELHKLLMKGCYLTGQDDDITNILDNNLGTGAIPSGGASLILIPPSLLDEPYNYDFTNISDKGVEFFRGGSIYTRPCGWQRYALKVKGKYPDDIWLEGRTPRADQYSSAEDEWAVSYHGTSYHNGLSIAEEGYKLSKGERFLYGKGIYSTPDIGVASLYAAEANVDGKTYKVVMQNRVNPKTVKKIGVTVTGVGEYWISPADEDILPYGFCVKEI